MLRLLIISILIFGLTAGAAASSWSYTNLTAWNYLNNTKCNGKMQSPINIVESATKVNTTLGSFTKNHFSPSPKLDTIMNNGHSLQVNVAGGYMLNDRNILPGVYWPAQFHFHWALQGSMAGGSEHTLNGKRYFAEMHIVHFNNNTVNNHLNEKDGIAVLGFFVQADATTNNTAFDKLLTFGRKVRNAGQTATLNTPLTISEFLPTNLGMYYRYRGSLTTPLCNEVVVWSVFQTPISISNAQKLEWQSLFYYNNSVSGQATLIGNNFRPVQKLNGRVVTRPGNEAPGSPHQCKITFLLMAVLPIAISWF